MSEIDRIRRLAAQMATQTSVRQEPEPVAEPEPERQHVHVTADDESEILSALGISTSAVATPSEEYHPEEGPLHFENDAEAPVEPEETQQHEEEHEEQVHLPHVEREHLTRFSGAEWFEECQNNTIIIAGQGGIGSYVTFLMSRLSPRAIYIYDMDKVETTNLAGQLYKRSDVGMYKVDAIASTVRDFSSYMSLFTSGEMFTQNSNGGNIMMCGFDNMQARQDFFKVWRNNVHSIPESERKRCLYVDGRLSAELLQVFCIRGDEEFFIQKYEQEFLFSDAEVTVNAPCTLKQTAFIANMIGSIMVNCYVNHCAILAGSVVRRLPFYTEYNAQTMMLQQDEMIM